MKKNVKTVLKYFCKDTVIVLLIIVTVAGMIYYYRLTGSLSAEVGNSFDLEIYNKIAAFDKFFIFLLPCIGGQLGTDIWRLRKKLKNDQKNEVGQSEKEA